MVQINKSLNSVVSWALLLVFMLFSTACSIFVTPIQNDIAGRAAVNDLNSYINKSQRVLACVQQAGGTCPAHVDPAKLAEDASIMARAPGYQANVIKSLMDKTPISIDSIKQGMNKAEIGAPVDDAQVKAAKFAAAALTDRTVTELEELIRVASGIKEPDPNKPLTLSKDEAGKFIRSVQEAHHFRGWAPLRFYLQGQRKVLSTETLEEQSESKALELAITELNIVDTYLTAYFENGKFVSIDIDMSNAETRETSAIKELKKKFGVSEDVAKDLSVKILTAIIGTKVGADNKYHLLTKKEDGGFVTRGGTKYAFPGISINIDPLSDSVLKVAKIDFTQVGSDIVRVFLEALGDKLGQLPADQTSTACKAIKNDQFGEYPKFKCYVEAEQQVKADQFTKVNELANQAESLAATATGEALRGVNWLSLNNEAIAKIIETAVGVIMRKATEKVAWCVYACTPKEKAETAFYGNSIIETIPLSVER